MSKLSDSSFLKQNYVDMHMYNATYFKLKLISKWNVETSFSLNFLVFFPRISEHEKTILRILQCYIFWIDLLNLLDKKWIMSWTHTS